MEGGERGKGEKEEEVGRERNLYEINAINLLCAQCLVERRREEEVGSGGGVKKSPKNLLNQNRAELAESEAGREERRCFGQGVRGVRESGR